MVCSPVLNFLSNPLCVGFSLFFVSLAELLGVSYVMQALKKMVLAGLANSDMSLFFVDSPSIGALEDSYLLVYTLRLWFYPAGAGSFASGEYFERNRGSCSTKSKSSEWLIRVAGLGSVSLRIKFFTPWGMRCEFRKSKERPVL